MYDAFYTSLGDADAVEMRNAFLAQNDREGFINLYEQLLPEHSGGPLLSLASGVDAVTRALTGRNASAAPGETSAWVQEITFYADKDKTDTYGFRSEGFGVAGGVERGTGLGNVGITAAFTSSDLEDPEAEAEEVLSANLLELGLYWRAQGQYWTTWARAAAGYATFTSERRFVGGGLNLTNEFGLERRSAWPRPGGASYERSATAASASARNSTPSISRSARKATPKKAAATASIWRSTTAKDTCSPPPPRSTSAWPWARTAGCARNCGSAGVRTSRSIRARPSPASARAVRTSSWTPATIEGGGPLRRLPPEHRQRTGHAVHQRRRRDDRGLRPLHAVPAGQLPVLERARRVRAASSAGQSTSFTPRGSGVRTPRRPPCPGARSDCVHVCGLTLTVRRDSPCPYSPPALSSCRASSARP